MTDTHKRFNEPDAAIDDRVAELLSQMTLAEKIGQMNQRGAAPGQIKSLAVFAAGEVGSILSHYDTAAINRMQKAAVEDSRLGIPLMVGNDIIHGCRTVFPIPLAESCSWDIDLIERTARMAAEEASALGTDWIFAPMVDIARDPRWGRIAEGAGEDPHLGAAMARARVRGFQATGLQSGKQLVACPKHFVAYGAAESGKDYNTVDISENTLRDVYLPPFAAAFDEGAGTVMSAFNEINGVPATCNAFTLQTILRDEWSFSGVVLSDAIAIKELIDHGVAEDLADAARGAATAGVDVDMGSDAYAQHLAAAVETGQVPVEIIDEAVGRILRLKLHLGLFENPYTDEKLAEEILLCAEHRDLALESARKSMVLLKNDHDLLPLTPEQRRVAVIGPLADDPEAPLGCWHCQGRASDVTTVLDGILAAAGPDFEVTFVRGCDVEDDSTDGFAEAMAVAAAADVVIAVVGESRTMSGEAECRADLGLPGAQQALIDALSATRTPIVAVLLNGRPLTIEPLAEQTEAILEAWHSGIETGRAAAEILFGHINPSGRLTVSFPRAVGQIPVYYAHKNTGRPAEGEGFTQFDLPYKSDYRDVPNAPLYPFGYGLSYTTFTYDKLEIHTPTVAADGSARISVEVTNIGQLAGDEVAQLYIRDVVASLTRPVKELKGFRRISLEAGQAQRVEFDIPVHSLGFTNAQMDYVVEPGLFEVHVGPNSAEGLIGTFEVTE